LGISGVFSVEKMWITLGYSRFFYPLKAPCNQNVEIYLTDFIHKKSIIHISTPSGRALPGYSGAQLLKPAVEKWISPSLRAPLPPYSRAPSSDKRSYPRNLVDNLWKTHDFGPPTKFSTKVLKLSQEFLTRFYGVLNE
jgi:hypothetical protein